MCNKIWIVNFLLHMKLEIRPSRVSINSKGDLNLSTWNNKMNFMWVCQIKYKY